MENFALPTLFPWAIFPAGKMNFLNSYRRTTLERVGGEEVPASAVLSGRDRRKPVPQRRATAPEVFFLAGVPTAPGGGFPRINRSRN